MERQHELLPFLVLWAVQFQRDYKLDGLHPTHYDLMQKYGGRMVEFRRATNARVAEAAFRIGDEADLSEAAQV